MPPCFHSSLILASVGLILLGNAMRRRRRRSRRSQGSDEALRFFHLKGKYYQWLGDAWDHDSKDFKPCYRPLYSCDAKADRFEAHVLAVRSFEKWEQMFAPCTYEELSLEARRFVVLEPNLLKDPDWPFPWLTSPVPPGATTDSGHGSRSHKIYGESNKNATVSTSTSTSSGSGGGLTAAAAAAVAAVAAVAPLEFFCADYCPFGQRVWIALEALGLPYRYQEVNLWCHALPLTRRFRALSPSKTVPTVLSPSSSSTSLSSDSSGIEGGEDATTIVGLDDSIPLLFYLDALASERGGKGGGDTKTLMPASAEARHEMHSLLSGGGLIGIIVQAFYGLLG